MTTNAKIFAFEPSVENLFCLTNTLLKLPAELQNRVALFPIALGKSNELRGLVEEQFNQGHHYISPKSNENELSAGGIIVRTADYIFGSPPMIDVLKVDTEGFECNVLDGARRLLPNTFTLKAECVPEVLRQQGCSKMGLANRLHLASFSLVMENFFDGSQGAFVPISGWFKAPVDGIDIFGSSKRLLNVSLAELVGTYTVMGHLVEPDLQYLSRILTNSNLITN